MSVFKRAEWHSGLTYQQTCRECGAVVQYTDEILDFRPWYADGFVYCPKCNTPLRHNEDYAIDGKQKAPVVAEEPVQEQFEEDQTVVLTSEVDAPSVPEEKVPEAVTQEPLSAFCHQCGKKFYEGDRFCTGCGAKRR